MRYFVTMDPALYYALHKVTASPTKVDLHGKSASEAEQIIDRLAVKGGVWEIVTGHGKGVLKDLLKRLQKVYDFRILSEAPNHAAFVVDFS
jgi:dsDNA-specific endonuclease/ATPase MutS2